MPASCTTNFGSRHFSYLRSGRPGSGNLLLDEGSNSMWTSGLRPGFRKKLPRPQIVEQTRAPPEQGGRETPFADAGRPRPPREPAKSWLRVRRLIGRVTVAAFSAPPAEGDLPSDYLKPAAAGATKIAENGLQTET
jgi:hypothetical protein